MMTQKNPTKLPPKTALVKYPENHQVFWFALETCGFQQRHSGPCKKQSAGPSHWTKPAIRSPAQCQQQSWICTRQKEKKTLLKPICSWRCTVIYEPEGFSGTWNTLWGGRNMISATWSPHKTALKTQTWHLQTVHHNSYLSGLRENDSVSQIIH